jgi:DNA-binding NarL/FixJ family response regulator
MEKQLIHIALADDHTIFRNGLVSSFQPFPHINILYTAASGEELLEGLNTHKPDVILVDIKMNGMDGVDTTRLIKNKYPHIKVLGLSMYENHNYITNMFKAGTSGFLFKDSSPEQIVGAIEFVTENDYYFNDQVSKKLLKSLLEIDHPSTNVSTVHVTLTQMEIELLKLIGLEKTNSEIAAALNLGVKTVENYRAKLLAKAGVKNTVGLVLFGIKRGYIIV